MEPYVEREREKEREREREKSEGCTVLLTIHSIYEFQKDTRLKTLFVSSLCDTLVHKHIHAYSNSFFIILPSFLLHFNKVVRSLN